MIEAGSCATIAENMANPDVTKNSSLSAQTIMLSPSTNSMTGESNLTSEGGRHLEQDVYQPYVHVGKQSIYSQHPGNEDAFFVHVRMPATNYSSIEFLNTAEVTGKKITADIDES